MSGELRPGEIESIASGGRRRRRWVWIGGATVAVVLVVGFILLRGRGGSVEVVRTATVAREAIASVLELSGQSAARRESKLSFNASGNTTVTGVVTDVLVEVGDQVKAGQVLATLDKRNATRSLQQSSARLETEQLRLRQQQATSPSDIASVQQAISSARAQLQRAENDYTNLLSPPSQTQDVAQARQKLADAQNQLAARQSDLDLLTAHGDTQREIEEIQRRVSELTSARRTAELLLENVLADPSTPGFERGAINSLRTAVDAACGAIGDRDICMQFAATSADLATLRTGFAQSGLRGGGSASAAIADVEQAFPIGTREPLRAALFDIARAQAWLPGLSARNNALVLSLAGTGVPSDAQFADAARARDAASAGVSAAQASLDRLVAGPTNAAQDAARREVESARQALTAAESKLSSLGQQQVVGTSMQEVEISLAEITKQQSQDALDDTVLKAPFDGTVGAVAISPGDLTSPSQTAITITDTSKMYIQLVVTEVDLPDLHAGQLGLATFDALQESLFVVQMIGVGNVGTTSQGVVTYQARAEILNGDAISKQRATVVDLLKGRGTLARQASPNEVEAALARLTNVALPAPAMNANVALMQNVELDALVVPVAAVHEQGAETYVVVRLQNGVQERRTVTTGLGDRSRIAILSGVNEGDQVVLGGAALATPGPTGQ